MKMLSRPRNPYSGKYKKYVCDTHAFIWFLTKDPQLGNKAKEIFEKSEIDKNIKIIIPTIVLGELYWILDRKIQEYKYKFAEILEIIDGKKQYQIHPLSYELIKLMPSVDRKIELRDLIIFLTANLEKASLVTKDHIFQGWGNLDVVW